MDVGNVLIIVNYVARIFAPIQTIGYFATYWLQCSVAVERLYELKPQSQDLLPLENLDIDKIETIKLVGLGAKHGTSFEIDGINMTFKRGELAVVSGESGTGKTTLIKLICGLAERSKGDIFVNGSKIDTPYKLVHKMSVSMQDAYIFNRNAKENIFYPTGEESENSSELINLLSMKSLVKRQYDDNSEQNFENKLSGGEKKRIGISRAMLKPADVYIFDEPTNDLDNKNAGNVIKNISTPAISGIITFKYLSAIIYVIIRIIIGNI
jgi:ABC-type multidrug transport system fused ATPase/permease subunit